MTKALIVIDIQNDYITGSYPQHNPTAVLGNNLKLAEKAKLSDVDIIFIQHETKTGSFLLKNSEGGQLHSSLQPYITATNVIKKSHADSFLNTELLSLLTKKGIETLYLTGFMTQNCVTHTALSVQAKVYDITVIADACGAPTERVHQIALNALKDRVAVKTIENIEF